MTVVTKLALPISIFLIAILVIAVQGGWIDWATSSRLLQYLYLQPSLDSSATLPDRLERAERAVQQDPVTPSRWCDLAELYLENGLPEQAERCINRAVELGPYLVPVLTRALNLDFRMTQETPALAHGRRLLRVAPSYAGVVFATYRRMGIAPQKVLASGLPDVPSAYAAYLNESATWDRLEDTIMIWENINERDYVTTQLCATYTELLIKKGLGRRALEAWLGHLSDKRDGFQTSTFVYNGGFERDFTGVPFDWEVSSLAGTEIDTELSETGERVLRLDFAGEENLTFHHLEQIVLLPSGRYTLTARIQSEGITTDKGVYLALEDLRRPTRMRVRTSQVLGTRDWGEIREDFHVSEPEVLLRLRVRRDPSFRIDSKIAGTVRIDDVTISRR